VCVRAEGEAGLSRHTLDHPPLARGWVGGVAAGIAAFAAEEREAVVKADVGLGVGQRSVVVLVPASVSMRQHT
jgi:hypothetical protein